MNSITVKKIIFHDPATIIYWGDGTKTVVKCMKGDEFNPELGVAMCMLKRMLDPPSYARYKKHTQEYVNEYLANKKKVEKVISSVSRANGKSSEDPFLELLANLAKKLDKKE